MDAISMIKDRRSIRNFTDEYVDRELLKEIVEISSFAPTWANTQTVRYSVVDDKSLLYKLGSEGMLDFKPNINTLSKAAGAVILSTVREKCGRGPDGDFVTTKKDAWEMFDAGVASQTFCLAAYEKGVGTVIMGIFDEDKVGKVIGLPEGEVVAAIIVYGYEKSHPRPTTRKELDELLRFIDAE